MSVCARGCCWSPYGCAHQRTCACHWEEKKARSRTNGTVTYRDPTATQAVNNIMRGQQPRDRKA